MGTKRDARGATKADRSKETSKHSNAADSKPNKSRMSERLLQEIITLGGTEKDLELVEDVISQDGSVEDTTPGPDLSKQLLKELHSFTAELGFEKVTHDDSSDSDSSHGEPETKAASGSSELALPHDVHAKQLEKSEPSSWSKKSSNVNTSLSCTPRPDWHAANMPAVASLPAGNHGCDQSTLAALKNYATELWYEDCDLYASVSQKDSGHRFMSTIMTSGTLADKVSALTLAIQESPLHSQKSLETLLGLAKKRSRGQALAALSAIKDLLGTGTVLPPDRHLQTFVQRQEVLAALSSEKHARWSPKQGPPRGITKQHLISWIFEDWLVQFYYDVLKILETWCNDEVQYARIQALTFVYELLRDKPEQESNLLRLLVNKLGDPEKKIASRASYLLLQLQTSHPLMKPIIVREINHEVLLRPGQNLNAKYYAATTLNQTVLSNREADLAQSLLDIYFSLFTTLLGQRDASMSRVGKSQAKAKPGEAHHHRSERTDQAKDTSESQQANLELYDKMLSAILTGVHRSFPFSQSSTAILDSHMDSLFRITHSANFSTSVQTLLVIEQLVSIKQTAADRFYRTLYESLLDPRLITTSKHALYLNLIFRAMRSDLNLNRVQAFVKRLTQVMTLHDPPFVCAAIYLLRQLEESLPSMRGIITEGERLKGFDDEDVDDPAIASPATSNPRARVTDSGYSSTSYDGRKRDPQYSRAETTSLWDILPFRTHFHPSVKLFAKSLLDGSNIPPKPDLSSQTVSHFLDRFAYRNPKADSARTKGTSIMQPLAGGDAGSILGVSVSTTAKPAVNTEGFWQKQLKDIDVNDAFFHRYFNHVNHRPTAKPSQNKNAEKSLNGHAEDDDEIWHALVQSRPDIEDDAEDFSDIGLSDDDASDFGGDASDGSEEALSAGSMDSESDTIMSEAELDDDGTQKRADPADAMGNMPSQRRKSRRRDFKHLPTFASVADYAEMIDNSDDSDGLVA